MTGDGPFTLTRVPQGVINATSYFQGMMVEVLENLGECVCLIYMDGVKVIGRFVEELIVNLRAVLLRCMERGLLFAAHKLVLLAKVVALRVAVEVGLPEGCVAELEDIVLGECLTRFGGPLRVRRRHAWPPCG